MKAYRQRQKSAANPTPEPEITPEELQQTEQLSRAAGVPRYPLSVWKAAARTLISGPETSPADRRKGLPTKVQALKAFCATDRDWRRKVADFVKADRTEAVRKFAAAQGWTVDGPAAPRSSVDGMVLAIEKGIREGHLSGPHDPLCEAYLIKSGFTAEELNSPAPPDPEHEKLWANYQKCRQTGSTKDPR